MAEGAGTRTTAPTPQRVATVPNLLSFARLGLAAGFAVAVLDVHQRIAGAALLAVAGVTDFLDGWIARRFDQESALGKVLDPTVDRVLLVTAAIVIVVSGAVPWWLTTIVLVREGAVASGALLLAVLRAPRIDVLLVGKAGTFVLMVCFPLLLLGHGPGEWARLVSDAADVALVPALGLSFVALAAYVPAARRALAARPRRAVREDRRSDPDGASAEARALRSS